MGLAITPLLLLYRRMRERAGSPGGLSHLVPSRRLKLGQTVARYLHKQYLQPVD
jgi:hypothetical protein